MSLETLRRTVMASWFAAMAAVGSYIHIPIGPVPIVLTNLFVLLAGLLLGSRWGLTSMLLYLFSGAIGIPVFAGGKGGLAHFFGPTGGYLLGYPLAAWMTGLISEHSKKDLRTEIGAVSIGSLMIYAAGIPWLKGVTSFSWDKALIVGMVPFIPGDVLKAAGAVILARALRPMFGRRGFRGLQEKEEND